jgi:hypothetical protein
MPEWLIADDHQGARPMRLTAFSVIAGILAVTAPAHAERPDCALFPDSRSRWACYDNVSRAPPEAATKPAAVKGKPVTSNRKAGRDN